jgi:NADH-quinone oxidoreductase subunit J
MELLHSLLTLFLLTTSLFIFISSNPVHSVLFLILSFCIAALILLLFSVDFLGLLFVMVYVGAVAVLFLFVVMMINTKKNSVKTFSALQYFLIIQVGIFIFIKLHFFFNDTFFNQFVENAIHSDFNDSILKIDNLHNTQIIGQALYNNYNIAVLIAGFVLLIALIGSISLTISFKNDQKLNKSYKQLSKIETSIHKFK